MTIFTLQGRQKPAAILSLWGGGIEKYSTKFYRYLPGTYFVLHT